MHSQKSNDEIQSAYRLTESEMMNHDFKVCKTAEGSITRKRRFANNKVFMSSQNFSEHIIDNLIIDHKSSSPVEPD